MTQYHQLVLQLLFIKCISSSKARGHCQKHPSQLARSFWSVQVPLATPPPGLAAPSLAGLSVCLWRRGRQGPNVRAAGTEDSEKQVRACSCVHSCTVLSLILGWGWGGVGYIGTRWWGSRPSLGRGRDPMTAHPSRLVHSFHGASQSPPRGPSRGK